MLPVRDTKIDGERGAASGKRRYVDGAAMLAHNGHADAESQTGSAARAFGGVEGVKEPRQSLGKNTDAVVRCATGNMPANAANAKLNAAGLANFADSVFSVTNEVEEDLNELIGVADNRRKIGLTLKIYLDVIAAEGMLVQLQRAFDESVDVDGLFLRRRGT